MQMNTVHQICWGLNTLSTSEHNITCHWFLWRSICERLITFPNVVPIPTALHLDSIIIWPNHFVVFSCADSFHIVGALSRMDLTVPEHAFYTLHLSWLFLFLPFLIILVSGDIYLLKNHWGPQNNICLCRMSISIMLEIKIFKLSFLLILLNMMINLLNFI